MIRAYMRVSTNDQTINSQYVAIDRLHKVDKWYKDEGISGATSNRLGLQKLLDELDDGDTVVCFDISRMFRSTSNFLSLMEDFKERNINFISLREGIDISTPQGKFLLTVFAAIAELNRGVIVNNVKAGLTAYKDRCEKGLDTLRVRGPDKRQRKLRGSPKVAQSI